MFKNLIRNIRGGRLCLEVTACRGPFRVVLNIHLELRRNEPT